MSNERAVLTRELNKSICFIHLKILSFASLYVVCWAMSLQLCPTLCNHIDGSLPGSSVYGILQQEYWGRLPFPPPGDLPDLRLLQVSGIVGGVLTAEPPRKLSLPILQSYMCGERAVRYTTNSLVSRTVNFDSYTKLLFFHNCFH